MGFGSGGVSSGGASASSVACATVSPVLPLDILVPGLPSIGWSASSSTFGRSSSSMSTSGASTNCSSGSPVPLPLLVNVAAAMPMGWCDLLPAVGFAWSSYSEMKLRYSFYTCQPCLVMF